MALKAVLVAAAAAAIFVGFVLPGPHPSRAEPKSQIATIELAR